MFVFSDGYVSLLWGFLGGSVVKNPPANARDAGDAVSVAGWWWEMATHFSILAWKISWTEEPGELQSMGLQSRTQLSTHIIIIIVDFNNPTRGARR